MISNLSYIHPKARLGNNVTIEPFAYIGENVEVGDGTWIGPHAVLMTGTTMGKNCRIFPGAVIGAIPQDLKYDGEESTLVIEDNVTVREFCTLNRGTKASMTTRIGKNSLLMAYVHIAHDCFVGENCILANNVNLAGHIELGDYVILGGLSGVHQFVKLGDHSMVAAGTIVRQDVPPYVKTGRDPLSYLGVNSIGLRRRGFTDEQINHIQDIYRILFVKGYNTKKAIEVIEETIEKSEERDYVLQFVKSAERGLIKGLTRNAKN